MIGATTTTADTATSIPMHLDHHIHSHQLPATASELVDMHSDSSPVSSSDDFSTRPVTDQPQEAFETNDDSDYDYDYDSDSDLSSDSWSYDDYDESSETDEPSSNTTHLIGDNGTLRLPSGKIISARSAPALSQTHQFRRNRKPLSPRSAKPSVSRARPTTADERQPESPPDSTGTQSQDQPAESEPSQPLFLSRREEKRYHTFIVRRAELRRSDMQSLAGLPLTQQQALLATTHKQIEKAERTEKRFTGKMDQLGNIKISERFVNDVPGGKAHKNRFFAR